MEAFTKLVQNAARTWLTSCTDGRPPVVHHGPTPPLTAVRLDSLQLTFRGLQVFKDLRRWRVRALPAIRPHAGA